MSGARGSGRPCGDDSGFTLIELMVVMLLTSLVLAMAGAFFVNVAKATATARATRDAMGQTSLAVNADITNIALKESAGQ